MDNQTPNSPQFDTATVSTLLNDYFCATLDAIAAECDLGSPSAAAEWTATDATRRILLYLWEELSAKERQQHWELALAVAKDEWNEMHPATEDSPDA